MSKIGERVMSRLEELGRRTPWLARRCEVPYRTMHGWWAGEREPAIPPDVLERMAPALDWKLDELLDVDAPLPGAPEYNNAREAFDDLEQRFFALRKLMGFGRREK